MTNRTGTVYFLDAAGGTRTMFLNSLPLERVKSQNENVVVRYGKAAVEISTEFSCFQS